ncbi:MAG: hypothetical protein OEZ20_08875 [candidate division WOR-3 bacterium]|nr:hypothetical protein [candidate division WOR-3 bacterium]
MLKRDVWLLARLSPKLYFSVEDLANLFQIKPESTKVLATRYTQKKIFIFDFVEQDDIFIASQEKSLIDSIYLYSC